MRTAKTILTRNSNYCRFGAACEVVMTTRRVITCVITVTSSRRLMLAVTTHWLVRRTSIPASCDSTRSRWSAVGGSRSGRATFWGFSLRGTTRWRGRLCRVPSQFSGIWSRGGQRWPPLNLWVLERRSGSTSASPTRTTTAVVSTPSLLCYVSAALLFKNYFTQVW